MPSVPAPAAISITVRLFAGIRERARTSHFTLRLPAGSTITAALDAAPAAVPGEWRLPKNLLLAINNEYATADTTLSDGDELALIPPVSGGAGPRRPERAAATRDLGRGRSSPSHLILISPDTLDPAPINSFVATDTDGAIVTFLGITRNHNEGRRVTYLEYEAFQPMAEQKIAEIIAAMQSKWEIGRVAVAHRTGRVDIGHTSMVLAVGAPHRRPAFEAALYFVDRLKEIVPIWKKEHFEGGETWVGETPGANKPIS